jgi:hypothetical protein
MRQAVHEKVCQHPIGKESRPVSWWPVGCYDDASGVVPLCNNFIECLGLFLGERRQAKIVNDEQLRLEERSHGLFVRVLNPCGSQFPEELGSRNKHSRVAVWGSRSPPGIITRSTQLINTSRLVFILIGLEVLIMPFTQLNHSA